MSHEKIFMNVTKAIERGTTTIDAAIANVDMDILSYTKLRDDLKVHAADETLGDAAKLEAFERIVEFGNNIIECNELKKSLIKYKK